MIAHVAKGGALGAAVGAVIGAATYSANSGKRATLNRHICKMQLKYMPTDPILMDAFSQLLKYREVDGNRTIAIFENIGKACDNMVMCYFQVGSLNVQFPGLVRWRAHRYFTDVKRNLHELQVVCKGMAMPRDAMGLAGISENITSCTENYMHNVMLSARYA